MYMDINITIEFKKSKRIAFHITNILECENKQLLKIVLTTFVDDYKTVNDYAP